jgi:uncharacterized membrane protein
VEKAAHVRNPIEWAAAHMEGLARAAPPQMAAAPTAIPAPRVITTADLRASLAAGWADFLAFRSDVIVLCFMYPIAGVVLWRFATGYNLLQLLFPLIAGFALVGPVFATGLYEMSRQREIGAPITWTTAFDAFRSPSIMRIAGLGLALLALFVAWLLTANWLYTVTLGSAHPTTISALAQDVLLTTPGRVMALVGVDIGFLFAVLVLCTSVISFPMLLDRPVTIPQAIETSMASVRTNPRVMAIWGLIVAAGLAIGTVPFLMGLIVTVPVLGHATWHLYRRLVP